MLKKQTNASAQKVQSARVQNPWKYPNRTSGF